MLSVNGPLPYKEENTAEAPQREKEQAEARQTEKELLPEAHSVDDRDRQAESKPPEGVAMSAAWLNAAVTEGNLAEQE